MPIQSEATGVSGLLRWSQNVTKGYDRVKITNMTSSWKSGLAFCAILHHYRPDLLEFSDLREDESYKNNFTAFAVAEKLGIPALLDASDMARISVPDRLSVITYVMQLYDYFKDKHAEHDVAHNVETCPELPQSSPPSEITTSAVICTSESERVNNNRSSDTDSIDSASIEFCHKCGKRVYLLEKVYADYFPFHRSCFVCKECGALLILGFYAHGAEEGQFVCLKHSRVGNFSKLETSPLQADSKNDIKESDHHDQTALSVDSGLNHSASSSLTDVDATGNAAASFSTNGTPKDVFIPKLNIDSVDTIPEDQEILPKDHSEGTIGQQKPGSSNLEKAQGDTVASPPVQKPVPPPRPSLTRRSGSRSPRPTEKPPAVPPKPKVQQRSLLSPQSPKMDPVPKEEYPEEKNPFGDEDEDSQEVVEQEVLLRKKSYEESLNPFGSDEEESGTESVSTPVVNKRQSVPVRNNTRDENLGKLNRASVTPSMLSSGRSSHPRRSKRAAPPPPSAPFRPSSRSSSLRRKTRPAPPRPLPQRRTVDYINPSAEAGQSFQVVTEAGMSDEKVSEELDTLASDMVELEEKAREVELRLRAELAHFSDSDLQKADLFSTWFDLVGKRNELIRRETELVHIRRQLHLDEIHADVEFRLRELLGKPKNEKSSTELAEEDHLLNRLLEIIEEKNALVQDAEAERQRQRADGEEESDENRVENANEPEVEKEKKKKHLKIKLKRPKKKHIKRLLESSGGGKSKHASASSAT